jgi:hypothetical protein
MVFFNEFSLLCAVHHQLRVYQPAFLNIRAEHLPDSHRTAIAVSTPGLHVLRLERQELHFLVPSGDVVMVYRSAYRAPRPIMSSSAPQASFSEGVTHHSVALCRVGAVRALAKDEAGHLSLPGATTRG